MFRSCSLCRQASKQYDAATAAVFTAIHELSLGKQASKQYDKGTAAVLTAVYLGNLSQVLELWCRQLQARDPIAILLQPVCSQAIQRLHNMDQYAGNTAFA